MLSFPENLKVKTWPEKKSNLNDEHAFGQPYTKNCWKLEAVQSDFWTDKNSTFDKLCLKHKLRIYLSSINNHAWHERGFAAGTDSTK